MKHGRAFALIVGAFLAGACGGSSPDLPVTPIADVIGGRVADGVRVVVTGTVISSMPLPSAASPSYGLARDGYKIVVVAAPGDPIPAIADQVEITGTVRTNYSISVPGEESVPYGTVIEESSRRPFIAADVSARGLWLWAGGIAAIIVLGWLIAWAVIRRSGGGAKRELGECRGCQEEIELAWVSCAWCGLKVDAKPPTPSTMIVAPAAAPGAMEDVARPGGSGNATIIVSPSDDGP